MCSFVHFSMYVGGTVDSVLIKELALFRRSLIERFVHDNKETAHK